MIFVGNDGAPPLPSERDVIIYPRNRPLRDISILSPNLDPMIYPLLFPNGDLGWHINMHHVEAHATAVETK